VRPFFDPNPARDDLILTELSFFECSLKLSESSGVASHRVEEDSMKRRLTNPLLLVLLGVPLGAQTRPTEIPVFAITPGNSTIKFYVKSSVSIKGVFDKWDATLTFASTDAATGVLDIKVQADSVNSGSGMTNKTMTGEKFFNAKVNPLITFKSTKIVQQGPNVFDVAGIFTIRGVSKPETMRLTVSGVGTGSGTIQGQMAFDRKEYGMNSGIPFIKIADRVEVDVDLQVKRVSGPALDLKK
jgi:polyisoprenoid-binding protein YceI